MATGCNKIHLWTPAGASVVHIPLSFQVGRHTDYEVCHALAPQRLSLAESPVHTPSWRRAPPRLQEATFTRTAQESEWSEPLQTASGPTQRDCKVSTRITTLLLVFLPQAFGCSWNSTATTLLLRGAEAFCCAYLTA